MSQKNQHKSRSRRALAFYWARKDSNLRRHKPSDLQSELRTRVSRGGGQTCDGGQDGRGNADHHENQNGGGR